MFRPTFSSPYSSGHRRFSPYYIPISLSFNSAISSPSLSCVHVTHGTLVNLHPYDGAWQFFLSPAYQGTVRIWSNESAFQDDAGRFSQASNVLELNVQFSSVGCAFLAEERVKTHSVIEMRLLCEQALRVEASNLVAENATIQSITTMEDATTAILLNPFSAKHVVTLGFTDSFVSRNKVVYDKLVVTLASGKEEARGASDEGVRGVSNASANEPTANTTCALSSSAILYGQHSAFLVTLQCSNTVSATSGEWLLCPDCTVLYHTLHNGTLFKAAIITPYTESLTLQVLNGAFRGAGKEYIPAVTPLTLNTLCQRPSVTLELTDPSDNTTRLDSFRHRVTATFSEDMLGASIGSADNLDIYHPDGLSVTATVVSTTWRSVVFELVFSEYGSALVAFKGGVALSMSSKDNQASNSLLVEATEEFFSVVSSMDAVRQVFMDQVSVRISASALLTMIHASDFVTLQCDIIKFVMGSVAGSTVIDMVVLVQQEGTFLVKLPKRAVALTNGIRNEEWSLEMEYVRGEGRVRRVRCRGREPGREDVPRDNTYHHQLVRDGGSGVRDAHVALQRVVLRHDQHPLRLHRQLEPSLLCARVPRDGGRALHPAEARSARVLSLTARLRAVLHENCRLPRHGARHLRVRPHAASHLLPRQPPDLLVAGNVPRHPDERGDQPRRAVRGAAHGELHRSGESRRIEHHVRFGCCLQCSHLVKVVFESEVACGGSLTIPASVVHDAAGNSLSNDVTLDYTFSPVFWHA